MLKDTTAFSGFSANDIDAERTFYANLLGVSVQEVMGDALMLTLGNQRVFIYPKDDHQPATYTVLNFEVTDVERTVEALRGAGITFERYEGLEQDELGIMRQFGPPIAWFKDPAGNILSVIQSRD